jgi:hypothetical protein
MTHPHATRTGGAHSRPPRRLAIGERADARDRGAIFVALLFIVVVGATIAHHEMWRDEWQAWMLARDSSSVGQILASALDEGQPPLWHLLLFLLSRMTRDPVAMQLLHLAIATGTAVLVIRFAPLSRLHRLLLAFSYFLAYEYAVIARPYAVGVLALFAFCAFFPARRQRPVPVYLALLVLAMSNAYGFILAACAGGMLLVERALRPDEDGRTRYLTIQRLIGAAVLVVCAAVLVVTRLGDAHHALARGLPFSLRDLADTLSTITRAYLPLPDFAVPHPWGTHFIGAESRGELVLSALLSLLLGAGALLLFSRTPLVLVLYIAGTASLLAFRHLVFPGWMRHDGYLFVLFAACLWLAALPLPEWRQPRWLDRITAPQGWRTLLVTAVLAAQAGAAAFMLVADLRRPFSAAPQVAAFIRDKDLEELPIGALPAPRGSSISGLLDRPIHYLSLGAAGTFIRWREYDAKRDLTPSMNLVRPFVDSHESAVLLILNRPLVEWDDDLRVEELARFPAGMEGTERYFLYRASRLQP